jgi:DNA topoisomerase I
MSKLVIVESNAKCKKIESFLGKGYKVVASFGHIRGITDGLKSIDVGNNYRPTYNILPTKKKYVANLRKAIKSSSEVILATDDDREGEAIAWHICKHFNLPLTTKRIKFREITKTAVKRAIENPGIIDINKFNSQQGRQILDLIVGYKLSPLLWKHISRNSKTGLSAGRCQTPALRLVYDREMEIKDSKGRKVYDTMGTFTLKKHFKQLEFNLNYNHKNEKEMETFLEDSVDFEHILEVKNVVEKEKKSPKPFTTSLLQQKSSNELHVSPKQTMRLAQTLYEHGWITYMRTDCDKYSKEFISKAKVFIVNNYGSEYYIDSLANKHCLKKEKSKGNNAQEAHEAIRPTDVNRTPKNCSPEGKIGDREIRLYKLIWNNTLESLLPYARYNSVTGIISAPDKHTYRNTEEEVKYPGWKIVKRDYDNKNPTYRKLKELIGKKTEINYDKINSKVSIKDLKMHYTEAKLVQLLEKKGIGRPSTFSSLLDKIQERKYVLKQDVKGKTIDCIDFELVDDELEEIQDQRIFGNEKNKLVIQSLGIMVLEFLIKYFDNIFDYDYTKNMENYLDDIENGKMLWHNLCSSCDDEIKNLSKEVKGRETYKIDNKHTYMIGKYGPVIKCDEGKDKVTFKNVKKNLDINKLKNGEYKLEDILELGKTTNNKILGKYKSEDVILKNGKFGLYINWDGKNHSIKHIKKNMAEITLEDVKDVLNNTGKANPNVLKILSKEISVRKGKYGPYVMYKTKLMKKPKFIKIKGIEIDDITLEWVYDQL